MQYIVIGHDGTDPAALDRRLSARPAHIKMGDEMRSKGKHLLGVALLNDEGKMAGSVMLVDFDSRDELDSWLEVEPYVVGKVWEKIEIKRCQVGPSFQSLFSSGRCG